MAIFGYGRISKTNLHIENQKLEIERAGYQLDFWYEDIGVSGSVPAHKRPEYSKLLEKIRDGETLVCTKIDRLGRDASDIIQNLKNLSERNIKVIVLQLGNLDLNSAAGKLITSVMSALGCMERDLIIERTKAGLERAKKTKKLGRPTKTTDSQRRIILEMLADGVSVSQLARDFNVSRANIIGIRKQAGTH